MLLLSLYHVFPQLTLSKLLAFNIYHVFWAESFLHGLDFLLSNGGENIKLGELRSQRIGTSALSWTTPHDFSFLVDQEWIYNLWFTTKFLGQIWWKKDLWVMLSNAKSMTGNLAMKSISATQYPLSDKLSYKIIYSFYDILVNCIQKGLRSHFLSNSAKFLKNIAKNQKELTIRKWNWINSFNSFLSIPIPIPIPFIQFLFNSNSWN